MDPTASRLINSDLAPVPPERRTWNQWHIASLWVGMSVCIPTYTLASGLIDGGMNWWQAVLTILLGNAIVLVPMVLNAHAGTKFGIPFPVFARASFGVLGSNVPAMLRAFVACGWFGIQTYFGGEAIFHLVEAVAKGTLSTGGWTANALGISLGEFLCFMIFWAINVYFIWKGTESIKWMETLAAPFLLAVGVGLLAWAYVKAGGFGAILARPMKFASTGEFLGYFFPALTAMVGYWATLSLNIPDFTRFARSQKDQVQGQAMGLPTTMTLFAFIGVAVTSATPLIFGVEQPIWDPVVLISRIGGLVAVAFGMVALSVATLSTNIAANVVSPANDLSNLAPRVISYKVGGYITAVVGILILPWKLIATSQGYIFTWLIGYSALLGPIGGILIADYYLLRRRELLVDDLYRRGGAYEYSAGVNGRAMVALGVGILPNVPGFLAAAGVVSRESVAGVFHGLYTYAWFVGFLVSGALYLALMRGTAPARQSADAR